MQRGFLQALNPTAFGGAKSDSKLGSTRRQEQTTTPMKR